MKPLDVDPLSVPCHICLAGTGAPCVVRAPRGSRYSHTITAKPHAARVRAAEAKEKKEGKRG